MKIIGLIIVLLGILASYYITKEIIVPPLTLTKEEVDHGHKVLRRIAFVSAIIVTVLWMIYL